MANKLTGELRLDLTQPGTAVDLARILEDLDSQDIERSDVVITLQAAIPHIGDLRRDPYGERPATGGMQLVATWGV
jgi:hypothetical protein